MKKLTPEQWASLREAVEADDQELFEHRVQQIAETAARNELARRTSRRQGAFVGGQPFFVLDR